MVDHLFLLFDCNYNWISSPSKHLFNYKVLYYRRSPKQNCMLTIYCFSQKNKLCNMMTFFTVDLSRLQIYSNSIRSVSPQSHISIRWCRLVPFLRLSKTLFGARCDVEVILLVIPLCSTDKLLFTVHLIRNNVHSSVTIRNVISKNLQCVKNHVFSRIRCDLGQFKALSVT